MPETIEAGADEWVEFPDIGKRFSKKLLHREKWAMIGELSYYSWEDGSSSGMCFFLDGGFLFGLYAPENEPITMREADFILQSLMCVGIGGGLDRMIKGRETLRARAEAAA